MRRPTKHKQQARRGIALVWAAVLLIVVFVFTAFTVDIGTITMTKAELQATADAAALGSIARLADGQKAVCEEANRIAGANIAAESSVSLAQDDIELGLFDLTTKSFDSTASPPNAVKVTARVIDRPLVFGPVFGQNDYTTEASAIAMLNPRDIVFAIDLSGSMNDDTEPCWAEDAINNAYASSGHGTVATGLMQQVFDDFGYGNYPGTYVEIGAPLGLANDSYTYAEMTKDNGPLTDGSIAATYRILNTDSEAVRKQKCYRWIIDNQIAPAMPLALPVPNSTTNYGYWEGYLDYIIHGAWVGEEPDDDDDGDDDDDDDPPSGPESPPAYGLLEFDGSLLARRLRQPSRRAVASTSTIPVMGDSGTTYPGCPRNGSNDWKYVPDWRNSNKIPYMNNPNGASFPSASVPWDWRNKLGYITYVQFMMDFGRDRSPDAENGTNCDPAVGTKVTLSTQSPDCPQHNESTAGGTFSFPPRSQPMHALRRSLIAGIELVRVRNAGIAAGSGDRVSVITFDGQDSYHAPQVVVPLTSNYLAAMTACSQLQATSDVGATTSTESGVRVAREHLTIKTSANNPSNSPTGPQGRSYSSKVIVLVTDGMPNVWESDTTSINGYMTANPSSEFYAPGYDWFNSVLMHTSRFYNKERGTLFPIGMGLGTDYGFMDRIARLAETDDAGSSPRGSGNPAEYEAQLIQTLKDIVNRPGSRLVE